MRWNYTLYTGIGLSMVVHGKQNDKNNDQWSDYEDFAVSLIVGAIYDVTFKVTERAAYPTILSKYYLSG